MSLGKNIRFARIKKDLTVKSLAKSINVSPSLLSKIEHDVTSPSLDVLREIAMVLHVSVGDLVDSGAGPSLNRETSDTAERVAVVKAQERKLLRLPNSGVEYQLLTPDLQGVAEMAWVELGPGQGGAVSILHQRGQEYALVIKGVLHVYIEDQPYVLCQGDCIAFDARLPHCYRNEGEEPVVYIYMGVPPNL